MGLEEKYTRLAEGFSEKSYRNVREFMRRRAEMVLKWGPELKQGDRILELACGDGYLGCLLAQYGLRYTGTDIAPGMIAVARRRAHEQGIQARFLTMDMNRPSISEEFEAIISFARTFFTYAEDPVRLLRWMRTHTLRKIVVDWNHFSPITLKGAVRLVKEAGFTNVEFRPFLAPMTRRIPPPAQDILYFIESCPSLGVVLTRRKFFVLIKGEVPGEAL